MSERLFYRGLQRVLRIARPQPSNCFKKHYSIKGRKTTSSLPRSRGDDERQAGGTNRRSSGTASYRLHTRSVIPKLVRKTAYVHLRILSQS